MSLRPYWQFYKDCFLFIFSFGLLCTVFFGWIKGIIFFCTLGLWIGFQAFRILKSEELYLYYNLGITKAMLYKKAIVINLVVAIPVSLIFILISYLFGNLTSI